MNQITRAVGELREMDELSAMDSAVHRAHPLAKLLITVVYIITVVSFSKYDLSGLVPMLLYPLLAFGMSGIPIRVCFYKLRVLLPLVCAVGLWNPFFDKTPAFLLGNFVVTGGMLSFVTLMLKGIYALMASFLLLATTRIEKICYVLRMFHIPEMLVTQLLITYRYISVLLHEAGIMVQAYTLRAPGQRGVHIFAWGSFLGQLLLRSMDRAKELYQSMLMRGFHGAFYYADVEVFRKTDGIYLLGWSAVILLLRFFRLAEWVGSIWM